MYIFLYLKHTEECILISIKTVAIIFLVLRIILMKKPPILKIKKIKHFQTERQGYFDDLLY